MNKAQKGILLGYCIVVFLLCVVWVPWKTRIGSIRDNSIIRIDITYAPIWNKTKPITSLSTSLSRRFRVFLPNPFSETTSIAIDHLAVELIASTLITGALYFLVGKKT